MNKRAEDCQNPFEQNFATRRALDDQKSAMKLPAWNCLSRPYARSPEEQAIKTFQANSCMGGRMAENLRISFVAMGLAFAAFAGPAFAETPYEVKAGVFEMSAMKGAAKDVVYFEDFGRKKATYKTVSVIPGQENHSLRIELPDGTSYDIDLDNKTGMRMRVPPEAANALAGAMAPQIAGGAKVKDLPAREFLGKPCKGVETEAMGMVMRSWTWKGILIHSEVMSAKRGGQPMVVDVTRVSEEPVAPEKFEVPAAVKIQGL